MTEQEKNNASAWKWTIVVLLLAIVGLLTWNFYGDSIKSSVDDYTTEVTISSSMEKVPTIDEAMAIRASTLESWRCETVYANIPDAIMRELFIKLGTQEPIKAYVYEYELNEAAYISKYVSDMAKISIDKNTANKIDKIEIKTALKDREKTIETVSLTPTDSVK